MAERGQGTFIPAIFYRDPMAALHWLEAAFGFETSLLVTDPAGDLGHAEMSFQGGALNIGGEFASQDLLGPARLQSPLSQDGVGTQFVRVALSEGLDAHCERARAAGARITQEPADQFYGARTYRALDPEGHVWTFQQVFAQVSDAEMERATGLTIRTSL